MSAINDHRDSPARQELVPIFVSLELSRVRWLVTWTFEGMKTGDGRALGKRSARAPSLRGRTAEISGMPVPRQ